MEETQACRIFLSRHVAVDTSSNVQCMLLFTEWVRFSMKAKRKRDFPKDVGIKEFTELIHEIYHPALTYDTFRGPLFVGIRFVK